MSNSGYKRLELSKLENRKTKPMSSSESIKEIEKFQWSKEVLHKHSKVSLKIIR